MTETRALPDLRAPAVGGGVRRWLRLEGVAALAAAVAVYATTGLGWGFFALAFLAPDLAIAAYLAGPRVGAAVYNAAHSYVGPLALAAAAHAGGWAGLLPAACLWAAHVGFDRMLGYGLKYATAFGDTHLGRLGRA